MPATTAMSRLRFAWTRECMFEPELNSEASVNAAEALATIARDLQHSLLFPPIEEPAPTVASQDFHEESANPANDNETSETPPGLEQSIYDPEHFAGFLAEWSEHLDQAESHLLIIETGPRQEESLSAMFRAFHSVKGAAGFLQLPNIVKFAHEAETLLDFARSGTIDLQGQALDLALSSVDVLKAQIVRLRDNPAGSEPANTRQSRESVLATLRAFASAVKTGERPAHDATELAATLPAALETRGATSEAGESVALHRF